MSKYIKANELYHHGIRGMKWGVRRYQNEDGTLTIEGKKRYQRDAKEQNWIIGEDGIARSQSKKTKGETRNADPDKWVKEDLERSKRLVDAASTMNNQLNNINSRTSNNKKINRANLDSMTDKELRDRINRELLERQYNDMFTPQNKTSGKQYVGNILRGAGDVLAITSSALAIALAIKELRN